MVKNFFAFCCLYLNILLMLTPHLLKLKAREVGDSTVALVLFDHYSSNSLRKFVTR